MSAHRDPQSRPDPSQKRLSHSLKRAIDIFGGAVLLAVTSPVIAAIAVAIRVSDGPPVLFRQRRPGRDEVLFTMYKFRTMRSPRHGRISTERMPNGLPEWACSSGAQVWTSCLSW